MDKKQKMIADH